MSLCGQVPHDAYVGTGNCSSVLAGRISNRLDLQGPSMPICTACSSSLVALNTARLHLWVQCSGALVGGVNLMLAPDVTINCCQASMLSRFGRCRSFDESADGYVRGEGCGMLLLGGAGESGLSGFQVLGSAVNQDGRGQGGLTVPNHNAQTRVIHQAMRCAELKPMDVDLLEAHGTGTIRGDPVEVRGLLSVFKERSSELFLSILTEVSS